MNAESYARFTEALVEGLRGDDRVIGLVALGSMAAVDYAADEWSDHDFFVVVRPGAQDDLRRDLAWLPSADRIVLSFPETEHGLKVVYDDGHLLELAVFDARELHLARVNRYRVLLDEDGSIASHMREIREATLRSNESHFRSDEWLVGQFLTNLMVGVARYRRGERLSGALFVRSHAAGHLLALLARHLTADASSLLDDLDSYRRFERVHPELGREVDDALGREPPATATRLLGIFERELAGRVPIDERALAVIRGAIET